MATIHTLGVVGVGLLGGSVALAARRRRVAGRVLGSDRSPAALKWAVAAGLLDEGHPDARAVAEAAEVVVFCTPVDTIAAEVLALAPACRPGALLTDVGSTKA